MRNVDDISAMRLRHVGYAIPAEFFGPFVAACVEIMQMQPGLTELVLEAFRWSLGLVASMFVRTIIEGLSIVMKAINGNSRRQIRNAIPCAPRVVRAQWMLKSSSGRRASRLDHHRARLSPAFPSHGSRCPVTRWAMGAHWQHSVWGFHQFVNWCS